MIAARAHVTSTSVHVCRRTAHRTELTHEVAGAPATHRALASRPAYRCARNLDALGAELPLAPQEGEVALLETRPCQDRGRPRSVAASRAISKAPLVSAARRCNHSRDSPVAGVTRSSITPKLNPAAAWTRHLRLIAHQELLSGSDGPFRCFAQPAHEACRLGSAAHPHRGDRASLSCNCLGAPRRPFTAPRPCG